MYQWKESITLMQPHNKWQIIIVVVTVWHLQYIPSIINVHYSLILGKPRSCESWSSSQNLRVILLPRESWLLTCLLLPRCYIVQANCKEKSKQQVTAAVSTTIAWTYQAHGCVSPAGESTALVSCFNPARLSCKPLNHPVAHGNLLTL